MIPPSGAAPSPKGQASDHDPTAGTRARGEASAPYPSHFTETTARPFLPHLRRCRSFGQVRGRNKLKAGSRLLVSPFPEIKFILSCCGVL